MTTNEGRRAPRVKAERDPLGMINGEGMITGTVVSASVIAASAGHLEETRLILAILGTAFIYWLAPPCSDSKKILPRFVSRP